MPKRDAYPKKTKDLRQRISPKKGIRRSAVKPGREAPVFPLLQEENSFRRAIEESIISGIAAFDNEGRQTYANEAFCKMVGWSQDELIGKEPPFLYWAREDRRNIARTFRNILEGGKPRASLELRFQRRNGERFDALLLYSALTDERGRRKGWVLSASDFTQQKRAEEQMRRVNAELEERVRWRTAGLESTTRKLEEKVAEHKEMEERIAHLASFPELNPNPVVEIDFTGQVYYQNSAAKRLFPDLSIQGSSHPYLAGVAALIGAAQIQKDISLVREQEVGTSWYHQSVHYSSQWNRIRIYGFDITDQKRAEEAIRESERKFRELFEGSRDGYAHVDMDGNILEFNSSFQKMLGYEGEELRRLFYRDLTPQKWHGMEADIIQNQVLPHGFSKVYEKEYRRKDGTIFPVSLRTYLFRDSKENPQGMWAFVRDISERRRMEEELRRSRDEMEKRVEERTAELSLANQDLQQKETLLRRVLENLPVGVWITDPRGRIIQSNPAGQQIWGGSRYVGPDQYGEYKGWGLDTGKRIGPQEWAAARAVTKGETSLNEEVEIECFDGTHKIILNSAIPLFDAGQRILGAIIVQQDITKRKWAQKTLAEQSRILESFFTSTMTPLVFLDQNFNFVRVNEAYARACQRNISDFPGHNHFEYYPHAENEAIFRRVVETKQPFQALAKPFSFPDHPEWGTTYWDWTLTPISDEKGEAEFLVFSLKDVTDRKKAEEGLKRSSLYTRGLIEASPDPLVTISPEGKITDVNRATELVTGVPREKIIGSDFSDYFTDPVKAREGYEEVFKKGSVQDYPLAIRHVAGKVTDVLYNATVYRNEAGEIQGVFAAARDITQRKQAEEALRQNEQLLRNVLELLPVGVWIADKEGVITYGNPAGQRIWAGYRYVGIGQFGEYKGWWVNTGKPIEPEEWAVARAIRKGETSLNEEVEIECFDGSHKIILNSAIPLRNDKNEITGAFIINDDITERRQAEQKIRQMQKMEALGTLAGGIAHDFNNILMPITINAEMALMDVKQGVLPSPSYMQLVKEAATRGQALVKQIITFSRQKEQPRQPVDINPVIKEALEFLRASIPKNIEIRSSIGVEPAVVLADPTQIHQVLMNLCSNAAFAMRGKGGILQVSLIRFQLDSEEATRQADLKPASYLRLTVADTGHGMDPEVRNRAFDPFFTTKKPGEGTGMGLAVVHGIVKNHEGGITLESEVGKGTTVHVFLPWAQADGPRPDVSAEPIPTGKERILLIDDEEIQVRTLQHMLERLGYRVIAKTRAPEALETFRTQPDAFDLLITDQTMPELSGANLAREVLQIRPDMPVILYTGYSETLDEEEARSIGIRDFALKPLTVRDMAERIRRALKK
jgi:PAS domain S-box-containing protein